MLNGYRVERTEHGILVFGSVPVNEFSALTKQWEKDGYDTMALGVAAALGASFAVSRKKDIDEWEKEINSNALKNAQGDPELAWLKGTDTGTSSLTIFSVLSEKHGHLVKSKFAFFMPGIPRDPSDFGRCYRLLKLFPAWRERLGEVVSRYPIWGPVVKDWPEIERLWEEESPTGTYPRLYDKICSLPVMEEKP